MSISRPLGRILFAVVFLYACMHAWAAPDTTTSSSEKTALIAGTVIHLSDEPLSGALIRMYAPEQSLESRAGVSTDTMSALCDPDTTSRLELGRTFSDTSGTFNILTRHRGKALLVACSDLYDAPTTASVTLNPVSTATVTLRFATKNSFSAYVTENGNPVSSATVRISYLQGDRIRQAIQKTGADGKARFTELPATALDQLEVRSAAHAGFTSTEKIPLPVRDHPIWLKRRGSIQVNVHDTNPATEKKSLTVSLMHAAQAGAQGAAVILAGQIPGTFTTVQHREAVDGSALFPEVEPGWYKAIARHTAAWGESQPVYIEADGEITRLSLTLEHNATIRGQILDSLTRKPIEGAAITVRPADAASNQVSPFTAQTDNDGNFSIADVPGGTLKLKAEHADYSPHSETVSVRSGAAKSVEVLMSAERPSLHGTVTAYGKPLANALIVLYKAGENEVPVATATSDHSGHYNLGKQDPGEFVASIEAPVGTADQISAKSYSVILEDKPVRLDMTFLRPVHVTGRIEWVNTRKPADPDQKTLLFTGLTGGSAGRVVPFNANDTFEAVLEPGLYSVGLEDRPGPEIEIPATEGAEILLEL